MRTIVYTTVALVVIHATITIGMAQSSSQSQKEVMTNSSVIELVKLGLGEAVIIQKIRQSDRKFDTSNAGLAQLKAAKVSDNIIIEMMNPSDSTNGGSRTTTNVSPRPKPISTGALRTETKLEESSQPYALFVDKEGKFGFPATVPAIVKTKAKGDDLASALADAEVMSIAEDAVVSGAAQAIMAAPGAAIPILGVGVYVLEKIPGIHRDPTYTFVYAVPGRKATSVISTTTPKFEMKFGDITGADPDEFQLAIVKLFPTKNNWRLLGIQKAKQKYYSSSDRIQYSFIEEIVQVRQNKISRGDVEIEPAQPLAPGEYGLVVRPISSTYKVSLKEAATKFGEGVLLAPVWDFSIEAPSIKP